MNSREESIADWARRWQRVGDDLAAERLLEPSDAALRGSMRAFDGLVLARLRAEPPSPDSGLVEQQALFRRIARANAL